MSLAIYREAGVGETRWLAVREAAPFALMIERWSEAGRRAVVGERYEARVLRVDQALGGAFVDLGFEPPGFLAFRRGAARPKAVIEGGAVVVDVRAEAFEDKGARVSLAPGVASGTKPRRLATADPRLALGLPPSTPITDVELDPFADAIDAALEEALSPSLDLAGGGRLWIERARAFTAIDLDLAGRGGSSDRGRRTLALTLTGVQAAARQIALRGLGGLIAVDAPNLAAAERAEVEAGFQAAATRFGLKADAAPINRFGVLMASVARTRRPIAEALFDSNGAPSVETLALQALRALEREGRARRGDRLTVRLGPAPAAWLDADPIGWRAAMTERLGARFEIERVDEPDDFVQIVTR